jgi:hypothetical protein
MSKKTQGHLRTGHACETENAGSHTENRAGTEQNMSEQDRAGLIQVRAYGLWEQGGRPYGDDSSLRFWCAAEKEILASAANE